MRNHDQQSAGERTESHITSLVVQCRPQAGADIAAAIAHIPAAEVVRSEPCGKIVVILETQKLHQVTEHIDQISAMDGAMSATLVFHQIEETAALDLPVEDLNANEDLCEPREASQ